MILNYFLLALRNLKKQRSYAIINILGLAVGLASSLFILLYVRDELTFDRNHQNAESIYRMGYWIQFPNGDTESVPYSPAGWDNYIQSNYEGIGAITSFMNQGMPTSIQGTGDKIVLTEDIIWAEPSLNQVLSIPVVKGNATNPLKEINSMLLTESAAYELYGNEDPVGKLISVSHMWATNGQKIEMMVTAVIKDFPSNTHIDPKYIGNIFALKPFNEGMENNLNTFMGDGNNQFWTQSLFVCEDESKIPIILSDLQKKADEIIARQNLQFKFKPLIRKITDVHFDQEISWSIVHKSVDIKYMYVFTTIAFLILVVACINYINLSTAKAAARAREIGLRKTFGGFRVQLFFQFMLESFLLVFLSAILAIILILIFIPQFNDLTNKTFTYQHIFNLPMMGIIGGVVLLVTLLAGSYPALFVSGFEPATVLKGKFAFGKGSNIFRQVLTTIQFGVAVVLLTGTVIVVNQMDLMRNSKLNEAGKQIISIRYGGFSGSATDAQYQSLKNLILEDPQIENVTLANHLPRLDFFGPINMQFQFPDVGDQKFEWFQLNGDYDFPKTFSLKLIAGRDFDPTNVADTTSILLNESAVRSLKLTPQEVIGKEVIRPRIVFSFGPPDSTQLPVHGTVIGVVEDFAYRSMNNKIDPLAIAPKPHSDDRIIHVRLPATGIGQKLGDIEKKWKQVFPDYGFDYWFIDEEFARMYENEIRVAALTEKFSWLAILVACVGLYGLASFMSEQRTKEIGIRKTMGASNGQVLGLLLKVFGKLLLIASIIGIPISYLLAQQWLQSFVYRTPLSFVVFGGALGAIALITLITVGYESLKASMANPIKALKHEG